MSLGIIFGQGSVPLIDLLTSFEPYGELVFALMDTEYARGFSGELGNFGRVVELTGDTHADAASLRQARVAGITVFHDDGIPIGARLANELALPFTSVAAAQALTDKYAQRTTLAAAGVGYVDCRPIRSPDDWEAAAADLGFPLIIKPRNGRGSRNTRLVFDVRSGRSVVERLMSGVGQNHETALVAEQYLSGADTAPYGDYVSVESVCSGKSVQHVAITGKFPLAWPFRETGYFYPAALPARLLKAIEDLATAALSALGFIHGITHTEIKLTPQGPQIIEVNGRIGGHIPSFYRRALKIDLVRMSADLALGNQVTWERRECDVTYWQYRAQPPVDADFLTRVDGADLLLTKDCIDSYQRYFRPGERLPADLRTANLDCTSGTAASPEEMMADADSWLPILTYEFSGRNGTTVMDGSALRSHNAQCPASEEQDKWACPS